MIDIDSLKGCAIIRPTSHEDIEHIKACKCCISHDDIPTAYDVDAVVEELENAKFLMPPENDNHYADNGLFLEDAIDIVRKGGVE